MIDADGNKRRVLRYKNLGNLSKKDAESRAAEVMMDSRRAGPRREQRIPTFSELETRYKRDILSMNALSTRLVRNTIQDTHLVPRFGPFLITDSEIDTAAIQRFFTELREKGYTKAGVQHQYSPLALHDIYKVMLVVMEYGKRWYKLPVDPVTCQAFNPVVGVKLPDLETVREKWKLTIEESGRLIGTVSGKKAKAMVASAIIAGLRREELLALKLSDISVRVDTDGRRRRVVQIKRAFYVRDSRDRKQKRVPAQWVLTKGSQPH